MDKGYFVCVDDEMSVTQTLREQLRQHFGTSHEIETANSAEEALRLIDEIQESGGMVEVIITDQVMPGMKGDRFLQEVNEKLPETIKILLTGQAGLDSAINAINRGGLNRYVEKPWDMDNLKVDIQDLISKFRQNIENQRLLNSLESHVHRLEQENRELHAQLEN